MHGFAVFLGKEMTEIARTWRLYVIPGIMLFIGLMSPILAEITPGLLSNLASSEGQGVVIQIPDATTVDAYLQFSNNAMQIALIAIIITAAGAVAGERRSGTAQLVLTKPVSRTAMVVAKVLSNWFLVLVATVVSAGICIGVTSLMFDTEVIREFIAMVALWYLLTCFMVALSILLSVLFKSQAGAAGAAIAVYFVMSVLTLWEALRDTTPIGLMGAGDRILVGSPDVSIGWPVVTGILATFGLILIASWVFRRQEL
jgi:ABC-2 type transport system permease protein